MKIEIKIPSVGESVQEAVLAEWFKKDGEVVKKGEPIFVIETEKVSLEIEAEADGMLSVAISEGETVAIGTVVGYIETEETAAAQPKDEKNAPEKEEVEVPDEKKEPEAAEKTAPAVSGPVKTEPPQKPEPSKPTEDDGEGRLLSPAVRRLVTEKGLDPDQIAGTGPGGRLTKGDVILYMESQKAHPSDASKTTTDSAAPVSDKVPSEPVRRVRMSPIRQRIAAHLLAAKQNTAMLTTFNEVDMSRLMAIRKENKELFKEVHGIALGIMSFFIKATIIALKEFPELNAYVEDKEIVYHDYYHFSVAISGKRGLVVPVIRHADQLSFAQIEQTILDFIEKIKENRLEMADLEGGTFTISNGGVFGSLLSTPILNMPQRGILGMHKIEKRPVVINDEIVIRPMMYLAMSYDHRIVDGREAVTFLKRIKESVETPERIMLEI